MNRALLCLALALWAPAVAAASPAAVDVLYHADLLGALATPTCGKPGPARATYADLVGTLGRLRTRAAEEGRFEPIALLGGNSFAPDLFVRAAIEARGPEAALGEVAELFARARYDAVALGHHDLARAPEERAAFLAALRARHVPVVLSNLSCAGPAQVLCDGVQSEAVVARGALRVGVVATINPTALLGLPAERREGLTLADPAAAVRNAVTSLRARGIDRVVLLAEFGGGAADLRDVAALTAALESGPAPDVVLTAGLADAGGDRALRLVRRDGAPPVVGSTAGVVGLSAVRWSLTAAAGGRAPLIDAERIEITTSPAGEGGAADEAAAERTLQGLREVYCARYGERLAPVAGQLDRAAFLVRLLDVMRDEAGAELAVINSGFVKRTPFPIHGDLTRADIYQALPYSSPLGIARVRGADVDALLGRLLGQPGVAMVGLARASSKPDAPLLVNGRPIDKSRQYSIATIPFVAEGGDGLIPAGKLNLLAPPRRGDQAPADVRSLLEGTLAQEAQHPPLQVGPVLHPEDRLLAVGLLDLSLDLGSTGIRNPGAYTDTQLARADQRSVRTNFTSVLQLRHPLHEADGRFQLLYGYSWTRPQGQPAVGAETVDLTTLSGTYNYRGLRARKERLPKAAVPDPYVRLLFETELTRPPERAFRHAELTNTYGALFTIVPQLRVRAGVGGRKELLADDVPRAGRVRPLIEAGATLTPWALATLERSTVRVEGVVDYFFVDPSGDREHQLRALGKLSFPLLPLLDLTAAIETFAVQRRRLGWGAAYDTTVGLRVHLDRAYQRL